MTITIASFNLENLFTRPTAMRDGIENGQQAIDDHAVANAIVCKEAYSEQDKDTLLELDRKYKFSATNPPSNALVFLNKIRGALFKRSGNTVTVVAGGAGDWTGWFELRRDDVSWPALSNTARVVTEVNADILVCIEVDNRPSLVRFNEQVLGPLKRSYPHAMAIDGNDSRGIDVALLSRFPIIGMRSHVDDKKGGSRIFSRDCPEYVLQLPGGPKPKSLVVCPNHFKSKRGGNDDDAQARRLAQGERAGEIARTARTQISEFTIVAGDLNDTPDSEAVAPLFKDGWTDIQDHASYPKDRPGTFDTGTARNKIDYIIMSPELRTHLVEAGIERRGTYRPNTWTPFETVTSKVNEASDHHCIWAKFDLGV